MFLLALKIVGIVLPTITALIAFVAKTKTNDGNLTRKGRVQIALMLLASLLGGAVLIIEHEQSRIASANQLSRMEALSTGLSRNLDVSKATLEGTSEALAASRELARQSESVLQSIKKTSDYVTGGESWPEVVPSVGYYPNRVIVSFGINVDGGGPSRTRTPLRTLNIDIIRDTNVDKDGNVGGPMIFHHVFESFFGGYDPSHMSPPQELTGDRQVFEVDSYALNGRWHQVIKMRKVRDKWEWRSVLYIPGASQVEVRKVLRREESAAFPADELRRPIQPVTTTDIGPR